MTAMRSIKQPAFDPWSMSIEQSLELPLDLDDKRSLLWQFVIASQLKDRRKLIEKGTGYDVLAAIAECMKHGLVIPPWLAGLFLKRFNVVKTHRARSWDDPAAFGPPVAKGTHLARVVKDKAAAPVIVAAVRRILTSDPNRAIDPLLFEDVAAHFGNRKGLGKTECARIYYAHVSELERHFGPMPTKKVGRFREKSKNRG